ncbi:MAG: acyl-CoA dehydrogenase [Alphaproteobacteria bacterium]|nr:acyl-CoA dehydrogenase [Alphaproteobacteria bacterium]
MPALNPQDPFLIDTLLNEDERLLRDATREFVQSELEPVVTQAARDGHFPRDLAPKMGEMGLFGLPLEGYGCLGLGYVSYGLVNYEVEYCDSAFRSFLSVQSSLVMHPIYTFATEEQKQKYLPKLASGEFIGCFGLTEPDAGSDPASMRSNAKKVDGGYILNGEKTWITNSPIADVFVVWAKDEAGDIRGFVLDKGMKGLSAPKMEGKLSLLASETGMIVMEDVFVPEENKFPEVKGLKGPFSCLNSARYGISWGAMGAAQACFDAAREYSIERHQFGKPLASKQLVQFKLANMSTEITLGRLLALQLGRLKDEGKDDHNMTSYAKRNNVGKALEISRVARDMHGGNGVSDEYKVMRHLMNLEAVNTYEGTSDIHALIIGRALTDIQAFM